MSNSPFTQQQNDVPSQDPGKTMGILSVVFSGANFLGFPTAIVGLILGYVARNQSRKAGVYDNTLAKVGIILGWIAVALTVVGIAGIMIFTFVAGNAVADKATDAANCISSSNSYSSNSDLSKCNQSDDQSYTNSIPDSSDDSWKDRFSDLN